MPALKVAALALIGAAQFALAFLFYTQPRLTFALLGRPLLDPVISRQYGLFLFSVALLYAIVATNVPAYRRLIWIAVAQRAAELAAVLLDWHAGALGASTFAMLAALEAGITIVLVVCARPPRRPPIAPPQRVPTRSERWLARALIAFGGLQLFWMVLSTIGVQFGARLLGWKLQDAFMTQQQGIALMVIGLTSLMLATDVRRYRPFLWVPLSSQALGLVNAVNEVRLGTITLTIAVVQWSIQAVIIALLLSLASPPEREAERSVPIGSPLA